MRVITLNATNQIISIKEVNSGYVLEPNDIADETGEIGQVRQEDGTYTYPEKTLDEVKKDKVTNIQKSYYASFTVFQSSALGSLKTYPIDIEAQNNLSDYQSRLIADPNKNTLYFKTIEDQTLILHNRSQFLQLMEDAEMFKVNQTIKINELIKQINAATTPEEVEAIVW